MSHFNHRSSIHGIEQNRKSSHENPPSKPRADQNQASEIQQNMNMQQTANTQMMPQDAGGHPFVIDMEKATMMNHTFRTSLWTGDYLQLTVMSLLPGEDIGLEVHPNTDQFVRVEEGQGFLVMGDARDHMTFKQMIFSDQAFIIPAGKWHNFINMGKRPLKLYSIYAPPEHLFGTVHETKADDTDH